MSRKATPAGAQVRAAAAKVLARVLREHAAADEALEAAPVAARDAALLAALVFGALRWHHRLEWQTRQLLTRPLKPSQFELAALLRLGLLQLQEFRIPPHAAVSATVDAATELGLAGARGLVNAVLRRFQRERTVLETKLRGNLEAELSHPAWLIERLRSERPGDWRAILEANNTQAPMWLRVNRRRIDRDAYLGKLREAGIEAAAAPEVASAVVLAEPRPVVELPGFAAGEVSVQDLAAQRAAPLLDLRPGQRVLDACAAPGGKTGHILETCAELADVTAIDRDAARLELVRENLERLGVAATLVAADATTPQNWWDGTPFDRILIDAPCSAIGVVRRHPDIKVLRRRQDVDGAAAVQAALLAALWPLLKPGGRLVYATCTVLKQENDAQIAAFLESDAASAGFAQLDDPPRQWLPGEAGGDGFYYACLRKSDVLRSSSVSLAQQ